MAVEPVADGRRGYAVLLPDPALSTGYGQEFIARGWGRGAAAPYTDLMAITDAAEQRADIDETRTAAMGGSFGGYMANWVARHTDRFKAIVTHASLWALDQFGPTTDAYHYWRARDVRRRWRRPTARTSSSSRSSTPMLVIHGDRDYRVPIGEALRLWAELASGMAATTARCRTSSCTSPTRTTGCSRLQHAKVWYSTVLAFLDTTVHGEPWAVPDALR